VRINKKIIFNGRVHLIDSNVVYASRGNSIYKSIDNGESWFFLTIAPVGLVWQLKSLSKLLVRLFRSGISHIRPVNESEILVFTSGYILIYSLCENRWISKSKIVGNRPLTIAQSPNVICYGEYRSNKARDPICVYCSMDNGVSWKNLYTFNSIRHIHSILWDSFEKVFWVTTGDSDSESMIFKADEYFTNVRKVFGGSQQFRSIQLLFSRKFVYFGTDAPNEQNFIYRFDRKGEDLEKLASVSGSVFSGINIEEIFFFATACEPSYINDTEYVRLYVSNGGDSWKCVIKFKKDSLGMKLFQYGQLFFPHVINKGSNDLFITPFACEFDQQILKVEKYEE
jgi:hypothetical protein